MKEVLNKKINNSGVTIVELLVYLGLSTIILLILSELFVNILDESVETQNYSTVQTDGRYIMARLRYQINNADSVTFPLSLGSSQNELIVVNSGNLYHYYVADEKFYMSDDGDVSQYLISNLDNRITDVSFTRTGNSDNLRPVILIDFTVSTGVEGTAEYESQTFIGAGGLR